MEAGVESPHYWTTRSDRDIDTNMQRRTWRLVRVTSHNVSVLCETSNIKYIEIDLHSGEADCPSSITIKPEMLIVAYSRKCF